MRSATGAKSRPGRSQTRGATMASKGVLERCSEPVETSCTEQEIACVAYGL